TRLWVAWPFPSMIVFFGPAPTIVTGSTMLSAPEASVYVAGDETPAKSITAPPPGMLSASSTAARSVHTPFGMPLAYAVAQMPSLSGAAPGTSPVLLTEKRGGWAATAERVPVNTEAVTASDTTIVSDRCRTIVTTPSAKPRIGDGRNPILRPQW